MRLSSERRNETVERVRRVYGEGYGRLRYPTTSEANAAERERESLLTSIRRLAASKGVAALSCQGTKVAGGELSPGCRICVEGRWSCLFINERCNTHCFYCPAPQQRLGVPMTNTLPFPRAREYVDYLAAFDFAGASLSGGEPLLTPDRTLGYIRAIKHRLGDRVHVWLYTNGTLLTAELAQRLRDAGLDEIRFDIGATGYRLDRVRLATGVVKYVSVEIPAIPEDRFLLQGKLREIAEAGVGALNLHQLRLTKHNFPRLVERPYTFLHGTHVTVLESELTALSLIEYALESGTGPPINYCSSVYKSRHQRAAARRRSASKIKREGEEVTPAGFIRQVKNHPDGAGFLLAYHEPRIVNAVTYSSPFVEIVLGGKRRIAVERIQACPEMEISSRDMDALVRLALQREVPPGAAPSAPVARAIEFELMEPGLQEYF